MDYRWTRTFSSAAAFSDELGSIGAWVGPRAGKSKRTQGQREDCPLRRLLVALLNSDGKGYQSRMNAILRQAMLNAK